MTLAIARHPVAFPARIESLYARLLKLLEHWHELAAQRRLEREAASVRRYAQSLQDHDPGMAADLLAAADRAFRR